MVYREAGNKLATAVAQAIRDGDVDDLATALAAWFTAIANANVRVEPDNSGGWRTNDGPGSRPLNPDNVIDVRTKRGRIKYSVPVSGMVWEYVAAWRPAVSPDIRAAEENDFFTWHNFGPKTVINPDKMIDTINERGTIVRQAKANQIEWPNIVFWRYSK